MKSLKNYIYEANLQGSTTKFSGALGAFKQYVELNPKNVEFKVDKTTVLSRMDGSSTDITVKKGTTFNIMDRETKLIKKVGRPNFTTNTVVLDHINVKRKIKNKKSNGTNDRKR